MNVKPVLVAVAIAAGLAGAFTAGRYTTTKRDAPATQPVAGSPEAPKQRKLLYYRNPMGLADTSPVPKKDAMGMDYLPVYEGDDEAGDAAGTVKLTAEKIQKLGVRTERVEQRQISRTLRAVGTLEVNERGLFTVAPKFDGWIERLYVNTTGQAVRKGQALMEVYAPELVSAQREYLIAHAGIKRLDQASEEARSGFRDLADAALTRLGYWDISEAQLKHLRESGEVKRTLTIVAPASGVILEKPSVAGKRFMAGEPLYQIADLSTLWLIAEVFEQDLAHVRVGQQVIFRVEAYPEQRFSGKVSFIYPTLSRETRTAKVRIELPNRGNQLKPAMYGTAELAAGSPRHVLALPESAVIDSGTRKVVLVERGEGRFEPRAVKTGSRGDAYLEVLEGVKEGESVVVRANFLIDSESNLMAALGGFSAEGSAAATPVKPAAPAAKVHSAKARVEAIDAGASSFTLTHGPIPSLKWPGMTMDFHVADKALLKGLKPGMAIAIEFEERGEGEYVLTRINTDAARRHDNPPHPHADEGRGEGARAGEGKH
jgi:RND family efflux transporter MFP subunit